MQCKATVVRLFAEWVTRTERRQVKPGRAATKDEAGSDSEYEEVDMSGWEEREEVQNRQRIMSPRIWVAFWHVPFRLNEKT